jgi:hypothetical protein
MSQKRQGLSGIAVFETSCGRLDVRQNAICKLATTCAYGQAVVGPESSKTTATPDIESCSTLSQPPMLLMVPPLSLKMMLEGYTMPGTSTRFPDRG